MNQEDRKRVEVCLTPNQYKLYKNEYSTVVVIDVLRATSAICAAIDNGVRSIIPVSTIEEAKEYQKNGFLAAAERNGEIVEGFDFGNSPYSYMDDQLIGKDVVLSTTNGTRAINIASDKETVVIGSLVNLKVLSEWLIQENKNTLILCSGWKNKINLEDTICAGAIAEALLDSGLFQAEEDSTITSKFIYQSSKDNMFSFLKASSHRRRLRKLNLNEDIKYCLMPNTVNSIPVLKDGKIVKLEINETVQ